MVLDNSSESDHIAALAGGISDGIYNFLTAAYRIHFTGHDCGVSRYLYFINVIPRKY